VIWNGPILYVSAAISKIARWGVVALVGLSAAALVAAPLSLPEACSWVSQTTSEAAAQIRG
jgi:hypothetical protein